MRASMLIPVLSVTAALGAGGLNAAPPTDPAQSFSDNCAACHQEDGKGIEGAFPALAGDSFVLGDPVPAIRIVLKGRGGMPTFAADLSDVQIAAALTHVRRSWGNKASAIDAGQVTRLRQGDAAPQSTKSIIAH